MSELSKGLKGALVSMDFTCHDLLTVGGDLRPESRQDAHDGDGQVSLVMVCVYIRSVYGTWSIRMCAIVSHLLVICVIHSLLNETHPS